jgi:diguanylate cyclase (GGDEF)-like protein
MEFSRPAAPDELSPFGAAEMARTLAWFYMAGGLLGGLSLLAPHAPEANVVVLAINTSSAFVAGVLLLRIGDRLPAWAISAFLAVGTLVITNAAYFDGHSSSVYTALYLFVGVEAFYFLPRSQALLQVTLMAASCAWVLDVTRSDGLPVQRWIMIVGVSLVAGLLVGGMRERIAGLLDRLSEAASTDALTGLLNRRAFEEAFATELERARRDGRPLSVLVGDLDGFKLVNDRGGHQVGDEALRRLARELERWKRRVDVVARVGGEEFALLVPGTGDEGAFSLADRIRLAVRETFADDPVPLTISFGIATFPDHADDEAGVLRGADQALYAAKAMGLDRCVVYGAELAESLGGDSASVADSSAV